MDSIDIIKKNLSEKKEEKRAAEKKIAALYSELAFEMQSTLDGGGLSSVLAELSETVGELFEPCDAFAMASFADRFIFRLSELSGHSITVLDFYPMTQKRERVCYVKNRYSDIAYERLSQMLVSPTVEYVADTDEVIAALYEGRADFALLPTAENGHRISSVYDSLGEHLLHICAKTESEQTNGDTLEISLVSEALPFALDGDVGISLSFSQSPLCEIGTALTALSHFGAKIGEVCSLDRGRYFVSATVTADGAVKILTFMYLFTYGFAPFGVWKE